MGCWCSKKDQAEDDGLQHPSNNAKREPPPPPPEEEMVKEVLSETPKLKPRPKSSLAPPPPPPIKPDQYTAQPTTKSNGSYKPEAPAPFPEPEKKKNPTPAPRHLDERSEQPQPSDEACSLSEAASISSSMSAAMTVMGMAASTRELREWEREEATSSSSLPNGKQHPVHKTSRSNNNGNGGSRRASPQRLHSSSYSGELAGGGGGKKERSSPAVVLSGAGCRSGRASPVPPPRSSSRSLSRDRSAGIKRDLGERSARRSVSPGAKRRELAAPNKSRRIPPMPPNKAAPATEQQAQAGDREAGKESLDNPSVSFECFIFL